MPPLDGQVVLITGAGGGLGRAYSHHLATVGASIAVADIDAGAAQKTAEDITANGGRARAFVADVADEDRVHGLVHDVVDRLGSVNVLINNAGGLLAPFGPMEGFTLAQWSRTIAVNLTGSWLCTQAVVPLMKAAKRGKIVNVSTTMVSQGTPTGAAPYVAAKAGVVGLTRALAKELGPCGITVNAIAPGLVPMDKAAQDPAKAELLRQVTEPVVSQQSLERVAVPEDLCGAIEFLASSASDFVTGQVLNVDGGWALT